MNESAQRIARIAAGRTDLIYELLADGETANATDPDGVSISQWCVYYGDVSALRQLLLSGAALSSLGFNVDLNGAAFHGHWQLCQFLLEQGADPNLPLPESGESPLHAALSGTQPAQHQVVQVLLAAGADPNARTKNGAATGAFMRDCRTRAETPLHRAAAFAAATTIQRLLDAGADLRARDANGDSPLGWGSWHRRPVEILRLLCFDEFRIHPDYQGMQLRLLGEPKP